MQLYKARVGSGSDDKFPDPAENVRISNPGNMTPIFYFANPDIYYCGGFRALDLNFGKNQTIIFQKMRQKPIHAS